MNKEIKGIMNTRFIKKIKNYSLNDLVIIHMGISDLLLKEKEYEDELSKNDSSSLINEYKHKLGLITRFIRLKKLGIDPDYVDLDIKEIINNAPSNLHNCLTKVFNNAGIKTYYDLLGYNEDMLLEVNGMNKVILNVIKKAIKKMNLSW